LRTGNVALQRGICIVGVKQNAHGVVSCLIQGKGGLAAIAAS